MENHEWDLHLDNMAPRMQGAHTINVQHVLRIVFPAPLRPGTNNFGLPDSDEEISAFIARREKVRDPPIWNTVISRYKDELMKTKHGSIFSADTAALQFRHLMLPKLAVPS